MSRVLAALLFVAACTTEVPVPTPAAPIVKTSARMIRAQPNEIVEPAATATASAQAIVARLAPRWGLARVPELAPAGEVPVAGGTIVRLQQVIDGIPVEAGELRVLVRPGGELVAMSGVPASADLRRATSSRFGGTPAAAVARAVAAAAPTARPLADPQRSRARQVWHRDGDRLIAAWLVEAYLDNGDAIRTVIAAEDMSTVLAHRSLVEHDAFQYRVWADTAPELHPHDSPNADFVPYPHATVQSDYPALAASALVSVSGNNHPGGSATPDPWLPAGAVDTQGNNVDAYSDTADPDGFTPPADFRASVTSAGAFDRAFDFKQSALASADQQMASITALFFTINWMHDFWYDAGFIETAANAQAGNLGRGGVEGDPILAEAQDSSGTNNANMATPDDGMSPRMQMYVWSGADNHALTVTQSAVETSPTSGVSTFGRTTYTATGSLVAATDATADAGTGDTLTDLCEASVAPLTNQIALVDRGLCSYKTKVVNAQIAGAAGVIIADVNPGYVPPTMGDDAAITTAITIPVMSVTQADGALLRAQAARSAPAVTTLFRGGTGPVLDGALDATVIGHEHGHYLHHRLSSCNTAMCAAMSEGWADFSALLLTSRAGDDFATGRFPLAQYATQSFADPAYFGIRRVPYSASVAADPLTFKHMAKGEALPLSAPITSTSASANNEAHNGGEIWATMLWQVYAAIQAEVGDFTAARTRMAKDVVAGLLLAPPDATPTEMRDALITAAEANTPGDGAVFATAFALRGLGSCAVAPPRDSTDFTGITESTVLAGNPVLGDEALTDTACDNDGTLDSGETATVAVPFENTGFFPVTGVTIAVTTPTPGLTIGNGNEAAGTLAPGAHHDLAIALAYDGGATKGTPAAGELDITITSAEGCTTTIAKTIPLRLDVDDTLDGETTDHFDTSATTWAPSGSETWQHVRPTALEGAWHGADVGHQSNNFLASPPLVVGTDADFTVGWTHRYSFEYSTNPNTAWDAGVVQLTTDNGTTWVDVSTLGVTPGYGPDVISNQAGSSLAGKTGYTHQNPAYPATDAVALNFGRQLAGQTVRLRFLIATDVAQDADGWDIDDFAVTGITNKPFGAQIANRGACVAPPAEADSPSDPVKPSGGCCDAAPLSGGNIVISLMIGVGIVRRRRVAVVR